MKQNNIPGIEITDKNDRRYISLVSRWGCTCETLTRDNFVRLMSEDLADALGRYKALNDQEKINDGELFFDFQPNVINGVPYECTLTPNDLYENQLGRCFDYVSQSKWWGKAVGWTLTYECRKGTFRSLSRGKVNLLMNEQDTERHDAEVQKMNDDIMRFYATARYCGD